ncbi:MAG TPA: copper-binding protein [Limnobacter sp.]|nr:copper-binding protein [Limnobacter sp.]
MNNRFKSSAATLALLASGFAFAGNHAGGHNHDHGSGKPAESTAAAAAMADGEIRRINSNTGKVTMKHGEIKSIQMPPMTMVFGVTDKAMLDGLKEGDKVKFDVKQEGSNYTITTIQKAQ